MYKENKRYFARNPELFLAMTAVASNAHAYIGPGIGIGTMLAILGLLTGIGLIQRCIRVEFSLGTHYRARLRGDLAEELI